MCNLLSLKKITMKFLRKFFFFCFVVVIGLQLELSEMSFRHCLPTDRLNADNDDNFDKPFKLPF